jgi:hypothetical protein
MAEFQLIWLNREDLECVGKIVKNVETVMTPEDAVKWALRQCSAGWSKTESAVTVWEDPPSRSSSKPGTIVIGPGGDIGLPLGRHRTAAIYKLPMDNLIQLGHSVVVGPNTLKSLAPDKTARATLLGIAKIGVVKW